MEKLLTVQEAAEILGYKYMTVYAKIQRKQITIQKIGRSVLISPADNRELFAQREKLAVIA